MSDTMGNIMPDRSSKNMSDRVSVGGDRPKKVIFLYPSYIWWSRADMILPAQTCYNPDLLRCSCRPVSRKQGKPSRSSARSQTGDWNGRPKAWDDPGNKPPGSIITFHHAMVTITYFSLPPKILVFDFCKHIYIYKQMCVHMYIYILYNLAKWKKSPTWYIIYSYLLVKENAPPRPSG